MVKKNTGRNLAVVSENETFSAHLILLALLLFLGVFFEYLFFSDWNLFVVGTIIVIYGILFISLIKRYRFNRSVVHDFLGSWKKELLMCGIFSVIAFIIGYFFLTPNGPGLSYDSVNYIVTAINLHKINFFFQGVYIPVLYDLWPPLYPSLIAALINMGIAAEESARLVTVLSYAFLIFPLFSLGTITMNRATGYLVCIISLVFYPFWFVTSWAWSEMPYIFFSVGSILLLTVYWIKDDKSNLWLYLSAMMASLAMLTRYIGLTLVITAIVVIFFKQRQMVSKTVKEAGFYLILSGIPLALWFLRNFIVSGHFTGHDKGLSYYNFFHQFLSLSVSLFIDFFGYFTSSAVFSVTFILIVISGIILIGSRLLTKWDYFKSLSGGKSIKSVIPVISYITIYLATILVLKTFWTQIDPIGTRLLCPIYPFLLVVGICLSIILITTITNKNFQKLIALAFCFTILILIISQAAASITFFQSINNGQGYNDKNFETTDPLFQWLKTNVSRSDSVCINTLTFWYIDYKYRIITCYIDVGTVIAKKDLEAILLSVLETDNRIHFVINMDKEQDAEKLPALDNRIQDIALKNNLSYETFTLHNSLIKYNVISIGLRIPQQSKLEKPRGYRLFELFSGT